MGHVDHGKTALVGALTGVDTDRLPEEKRRGVSIVLGFAHGTFDGAEIDFIDMPGHERFVRAMAAGATGVDGALLVVAASEGVMPQTREHLDIAHLLGLRHLIPVVSKCDLVDAGRVARVAAEVGRLCEHAGFDAPPALGVSIRDGRGLAALREALGALAGRAQARPADGFVWLPIDRAFTIAGRGTVVTGTLRGGPLQDGAELVLMPAGRPVRMRGLQVHGNPVANAGPGQRVAVNLRDLDVHDLPKGPALASPGALVASRRLTVTLRTTPDAPAVRTGMRLALLIGSTEVQARLRLLHGDAPDLAAGTLAQLDTTEPLATPVGERFVLRLPSPARTVAGGEVVDPDAPRLRRGDRAGLARWASLARIPPRDRAQVLLAQAGRAGLPLSRLALLTGRTAQAVVADLDRLGASRLPSGLVVTDGALDEVGRELVVRLREGLDAHPTGMPRRALAIAPDLAPEVLDAALRRRIDAGHIRQVGTAFRLAPSRPQAQAEADRALAFARAMASRLRAAALSPPDISDLAPSPAARRTLDALVKAGVAVRTLDRVQKRELVVHREAIVQACALLTPHLRPPGLTVGEAGGRLGLSRKFSVPLLEYLDAVRFTRRVGDRRVLGPAGPPC